VIVGVVASFQMRTNNINKFASRLLISATFRQSPKQVLDLIKTNSHQVFFLTSELAFLPISSLGQLQYILAPNLSVSMNLKVSSL